MFVSELSVRDHWLFIDRVEKEKQTIVIEIEALSSNLDTAIKAKVSCFFVFAAFNTVFIAIVSLPFCGRVLSICVIVTVYRNAKTAVQSLKVKKGDTHGHL